MNLQSSAYGAVSGTPPVKAHPRRPAVLVLGGCVFIPWLLFCLTFWLRSFEIRYAGERSSASSANATSAEGTALSVADVLVYCLLAPILVFIVMAVNHPRGPMVILAQTSVLAWLVGYFAGDWNYVTNMQPYYEITDLNVYPAVDPSKFEGSQLMDAGMIQFTQGSTLWLEKAVGFKNEDIYCVVPIRAASNVTQLTYDFWAVGLNCCSAHRPDFACGEFANPKARWGLRFMEDKYLNSKQSMFLLAVKEAEAAYNLNVSHPVFLYWLEDPLAEVDAHEEHGYRTFVNCVFGYASVQLFLVLLLAGLEVKHL